MADIVDGMMASPWASVSVTNTGVHDVRVVGVEVRFVGCRDGPVVQAKNIFDTDSDDDSTLYTAPPQVVGSGTEGVVIVAGQTKPLAFEISLPLFSSSSSRTASLASYSYLHLTITYTKVCEREGGLQDGEAETHHLYLTHPLKHTPIHSPHKITLPHPSGIISYAILRPPLSNITCQVAGASNTPHPHPTEHQDTNQYHSNGKQNSRKQHGNAGKLPVLLALHGAGLEASDPMVKHSLDEMEDLCAWVLFPTGVTKWSGDDWRAYTVPSTILLSLTSLHCAKIHTILCVLS